jgi:hypothetical protein
MKAMKLVLLLALVSFGAYSSFKAETDVRKIRADRAVSSPLKNIEDGKIRPIKKAVEVRMNSF